MALFESLNFGGLKDSLKKPKPESSGPKEVLPRREKSSRIQNQKEVQEDVAGESKICHF